MMTKTRALVHLALACLAPSLVAAGTALAAGNQLNEARAHIKHVVIIMQENRSFDTYFGTFPGADGIVGNKVCLLDDLNDPSQGCTSLYYDANDIMSGGPHGAYDGEYDVDDGITTAKMDGFASDAERQHQHNCNRNPKGPYCPGIAPNPDAMGYHNGDDLPVYWAYAKNFLLQDRMFEGVRSWSNDSHIDLFSEWTANCTNPQDQTTCTTTSNIVRPTPETVFPWASLMVLLDKYKVSWKWYLSQGLEPDCSTEFDDCIPQPQLPGVASIWNPVPYFLTVQKEGKAYIEAHNPSVDQFLLDLKNGTLPEVSWITPSAAISEHPNNGSDAGQNYVASLVNAVMNSPNWQDTAIFISWDDWGGFYDHVEPPISVINNDGDPYPVEGFGLRVPGLLVSAWAKRGIDHQTLSFENYAVLIENLFANSHHLDPAKLGLPDARPIIPDELTSVGFVDGSTEKVGDLLQEFNFNQNPLPTQIQTTHLPENINIKCTTALVNLECTSDTVVVYWNSLTGPNVPESFTYHVTRDGVELPSCTTTGTECEDTAPSGTHIWRVFSVDPSGVESPSAAGVQYSLP